MEELRTSGDSLQAESLRLKRIASHPNRLLFPEPLETEYRESYRRASRSHVRIAAAVAFFLAAASLTHPSQILLTYGLVCPSLLLLFLLTFTRHFERLMEPALFTVSLIASAFPALSRAALGRIVDAPGHLEVAIHLFLVGTLAVVIFAIHTLARMRFAQATIVSFIAIALYELAYLSVHGWSVAMASITRINLLVYTGMAMCGSYLMERNSRIQFIQARQIETERRKSEGLLLNVMPAPIAERLKEGATTISDRFSEVSVLFADIVDFTPLSARLSAGEVVDLLKAVFTSFDRLTADYGLEKIKTIGDSYMVVAGLPEFRADHAEAIAAFALDMQRVATRFTRDDGQAIRLRIGINIGPVVAGVIGARRFQYDLWGDTVNMASRMESQGVPGAIQVTEAYYERLKDQYVFEKRGRIEVKGGGEVTVYLLKAPKPSPQLDAEKAKA